MNCCDKKCKYKELNGGDEISDFYFCKYVGITVDRGTEECLLDVFYRETYQEAIEYFKNLKKTISNKYVESYDLAIDALEKQMPMKVKYPINKDGEFNKLVTYCFSCGETIKDMKYCYNCGQMLDWEI